MESQEDKEIMLGDEWKTHIWISKHKTKFTSYTLRQLLQEIGDIMLQIHPDWLLNVMFRDYVPIPNAKNRDYLSINGKLEDVGMSYDKQEFPKWIIPDLRKPNEYNKIKELGGKCIRVIKIEHNKQCGSCEKSFTKLGEDNTCPFCGSGNWIYGNIDTHISETGLDHISDWDYVIEAEHGDIDSLIKQVKEMLIKFEKYE